MRRFKLTIEDEAHIRNVAAVRFARWQAWLAAIAAIAIVAAVTVAVIFFTPLQRYMPGYMEETQRNATLEDLEKIDSLQRISDTNARYIDNLLGILNDTREANADSARWGGALKPITDTLMTRTPRERAFAARIEERDRYNLTITQPIASQGMLFSPLAEGATYTADSHDNYVARAMVPASATICAPTGGMVVGITYLPASGYSVMLQHSNGFLSRIGGLGTPLVKEGDELQAGEAIAPTGVGSGRNAGYVTLEMWRDGSRLAPYAIINGRSDKVRPAADPDDDPMQRRR